MDSVGVKEKIQYTVYQNFPSLPDATIFWKYDIKIWKESLVNYKRLGYRTKLYCTHAERFLIEAWGLDRLYDEIDVDLFEDNPILKTVNLHYFWSSRKMECMRFQLTLDPNSIYSDTDVVMNKPFKLDDIDILCWSSEFEKRENNIIYCSWDHLSMPKNYKMPDFIYNTPNAYNCGILWFSNPDWFNIFYVHYLNFVIGNPCKYVGPDTSMSEGRARVLFACNAEQRILRAIAELYCLKVGYIETNSQNGNAEDGIHYYCIKIKERPAYEQKVNYNFRNPEDNNGGDGDKA